MLHYDAVAKFSEVQLDAANIELPGEQRLSARAQRDPDRNPKASVKSLIGEFVTG